MGRKKVAWGKGTVFLVPLLDADCGVGQVVTKEVMGRPAVALFSLRLPRKIELANVPELKASECISLLTLMGGYALDKGIWLAFGQRELARDGGKGENWKFRRNPRIGFGLFSDNIVDAFLNAYHGLEPWDDFADPAFLDGLLLPPHTRASGVILKKQ